MENAEKVRENRLRRKADRLGLQLRKSRAKEWKLHDRMGYMLVSIEIGAAVFGGDFGLELDDVEDYLNQYESDLREETAE